MNEVNKLLDWARNEIGTKADSDNVVIYNIDYRAPGAAWCVIFLWDMFRLCGFSNLFFNGGKCASCTKLYNEWAVPNKLDVPKTDIQPGDLVIFQFGSNRHIGICESFDGKYVTTIDGNTCEDGKEWMGMQVMRRKRSVTFIKWVIRPRYTVEKPKNKEEYYTVVKGDNLTKIAKTTGTNKKDLLELNPQITNPNLIFVGQKIRIK